MRRELHAEWTKLRTAPSSAWLPPLAAALTVALSAVITGLAGPDTTACAQGCDTTRLSLSGVYLGQVAVIVLAVLVIGGEYGTGLISVTLIATPRRLRVLAAKAGVVTGAAFASGLLAVAGSLIVGRILLPGNGFTDAAGFPPLSLADGPTLRAAAGTVLYFGLTGLFGLGVATVFRDTATALTTVLGLYYLAPLLAQIVGDERWQRLIEQYAPMPAGLAVQATTNLDSLPIRPWHGLGVLAAYAATALLVGVLRLTGARLRCERGYRS